MKKLITSFAIAGMVLALAPAAQAADIPLDNPLVPTGLVVGNTFQLVFVSSTTRDATSADVAVYDTHVQNAANGATLALSGYTWKAAAATLGTHANSNVSVPEAVYLVNGTKVADAGAFWSQNHDAKMNINENGIGGIVSDVWTGANWEGWRSGGAGGLGEGTLSSVGDSDSTAQQWAGDNPYVDNTTTLPLYGVSEVLTVIAAAGGTTTTAGGTTTTAAATTTTAAATTTTAAATTTTVAATTTTTTTAAAGGGLVSDPGGFTAPAGLSLGNTYQLVFVSSTTRDATSNDSADYDTHVQNAANAAGIGSGVSVTWKAIASLNVPLVHAGNYVGATEAVYLVDGTKVASAGAFWSQTHDAAINIDEDGNTYNGNVWTGTDWEGWRNNSGLGTLGGNGGNSAYGKSDVYLNATWAVDALVVQSTSLPFYAVSEELTVVAGAGPVATPGTLIFGK
jgi:hypothetical protein